VQCRSPTLLLEILELQAVEQGKYEEEKKKKSAKRWEEEQSYIDISGRCRRR